MTSFNLLEEDKITGNGSSGLLVQTLTVDYGIQFYGAKHKRELYLICTHFIKEN